MEEPSGQAGGAPTGDWPATTGGDQPSEQELRAAYEAELNRISSSDMILQTTVSLINIGGHRLGLTAPGVPPTESERDLEQVRDAIDGARALMPILERRMPRELGPMRDAIAQLQIAYAREAQSKGAAAPTVSPTTPNEPSAPADKAGSAAPAGREGEAQDGPGPAQASGRLWVPGR
jgi:hypothetical protein